MVLPPGRKPLGDEWYARHLKSYSDSVSKMDQHRDFPENTCPASRHAQMIAEALLEHRQYPMLEEEPEHCAGTIASVVGSLYQARSFLKSLGYDWRVLDNGDIEWYIKEHETDISWYEEHNREDLMSNPGDKEYD